MASIQRRHNKHRAKVRIPKPLREHYDGAEFLYRTIHTADGRAARAEANAWEAELRAMGRNAMDVRATVETLAKEGVRVHCLALGGVDLTSPAGKMTMAVITAVAEFERDLLIERTQAGLSRAKAEGRKLGRRPTLTPDQQAEVLRKRAEGLSLGALAKLYGVSRAAIQRVERHARSL